MGGAWLSGMSGRWRSSSLRRDVKRRMASVLVSLFFCLVWILLAGFVVVIIGLVICMLSWVF